MTRPVLLVHLSDLHIGATWAFGDPLVGLRAAVKSVLALPDRPDAVFVSGDLADNAARGEYESARELLNLIGAPVYVLPGNHDDRATLRDVFDLPGEPDAPLQYVVDVGSLRLVLLDSTRPGEDGGELGQSRLGWLDAALAAAPDRPTLVAMHHPPFATGVRAWDAIGITVADRLALGEILMSHSQVQCVVAGHLHRTIIGELAGRVALSVPSTYVQASPSFQTHVVELATEPAGFAIHALLDGKIVSHLQSVAETK